MNKLFLLFMVSLMTVASFGQYKITGVIVDSKTSEPLPGATATITQEGSTKAEGQSSDLDGNFTIKASEGKYLFKVVFLGYTSYEKTIDVTGDIAMGKIRLRPEDKELKEVKVTGTLQRQEQKGDTTVFNAAAFKVNPDATTEDLLKKIPGMSVEGSTVKSGGESVRKVLVDGKEFFGNDPMMALRNISADMVSKIEVFDRQSDQSQFTGFNDGNDEKTINILTKMGINKGAFGRVYGGYGTDDRYEGGGNFNVFVGSHRVSLIGMLNNVNQQNFSFDDITGAMSNGGGRSMRGMFGAGQGGKNRTGKIGINYTYDDDKKWQIQFSYSYDNLKNVSESSSTQEYSTAEGFDADVDSLRVYQSESNSEGRNNNHRVSLRMEYQMNDKNSFVFTPNISWQGNKNIGWDTGEDVYYTSLNAYKRGDASSPYLITSQDDDNKTTGLSLNGSLLWRHKFNLDRRTLSLNIGTNVSTSNSDQTSTSSNEYVSLNRSLKTSQITSNDSKNMSYNASLQYTEPIGEYMALQLNYSPSIQLSDGDRSVEADTAVAGVFTGDYKFSPKLSNKKNSTYVQQRAGIGLNIFKSRDFNVTLGVDYQHASLDGEQEYPYSFETNKSYQSILPSVQVRFSKNRTTNIRFNYRTSTSAPSISNLQRVIDVSNIRRYSAGNDQLDQQYSHNIRLMFTTMNIETSRMMFIRGSFSASSDYITTSSVVAKKDSILPDFGYNILLPMGTEFSKPINMNGQYSADIDVTLGTPVKWLGSNVNLNLAASVGSTPSMLDNRKVTTDKYRLTGGLTIGSSFSEKCDFTLSYRGNYNIEKSSSSNVDNNYYSHTASCNMNFYLWDRLVITNSMSHQLTDGMGEGYDNNYLMWNAAIGYKFFKKRQGELRLRLNDILDNNQSVTQNLTTLYVQKAKTDVLRQYVMLTFTYKFTQIGDAPKNNGFMPGMPGGGAGGRGGRRPPMMGGPMF